MIKVEVIKEFTYKNFDKIKDTLKRISSKNEDGRLYKGDIFECDKNTFEYLTGKNGEGITVVRVIEVIPKSRVSKKNKK